MTTHPLAHIEVPRLLKKPDGTRKRVDTHVELAEALEDGWLVSLPTAAPAPVLVDEFGYPLSHYGGDPTQDGAGQTGESLTVEATTAADEPDNDATGTVEDGADGGAALLRPHSKPKGQAGKKK